MLTTTRSPRTLPFLRAALIFLLASPVFAQALNPAVTADPPADPAHPARMEPVRIPSHGSLMNGVLYLASGAGPHPAVLLLHGLPGNEQNLDLAQALRRAGYSVLTFHYRGSWGSGGAFSLAHAGEDGQAALAFLTAPAQLNRYGLDPKRVIVVGHSMGGFVAAQVAAAHPGIAACALIAPWDYSADQALFRVPEPRFSQAAASAFDDVDGRIGQATGRGIAREILDPRRDWRLASLAPGLARHRCWVALAERDSEDDKAVALLPALEAAHADVTVVRMDTDHPFSDKRLALASALIDWLRQRGF